MQVIEVPRLKYRANEAEGVDDGQGDSVASAVGQIVHQRQPQGAEGQDDNHQVCVDRMIVALRFQLLGGQPCARRGKAQGSTTKSPGMSAPFAELKII